MRNLLVILLLFPVLAFSQSIPGGAVVQGQTLTPNLWNTSMAAKMDYGVVPLSLGGNGTATPSLTAGSNITLTGTWPNYTISGNQQTIGVYPVATPVTSTTIAAAEALACAAGGGIVQIPAGTYTAASGAITGPVPYCSTASVIYNGAGYSVGSASTYNYGTHFIGNGTFDFFDYNNVDCGGGTCVSPTSAATFFAGMLGGVGIENMTIDGFQYGIKCGALFNPGCQNSIFNNVNIINSTQWGLWAENFWGQTLFENIRSAGNALGQMAFCSSGGSANENGNSYARNLFSESASGLNSRGIYACARGAPGVSGGSSLNQFLVDGVISIQEGSSAITQAAVVASTTAAVTPTNGSATIILSSEPFHGYQPIVFATSIGTGTCTGIGATCVTAGVTYYAYNTFGSNFQVSTTPSSAGVITFSCSGSCASSTISSPAIYVAANLTNLPLDAEVTITGTTTNSNFITGQTYYVVYNAVSTGASTAGFVELGAYPGGVPTTPASGTGAVSGMNVKNFGPSPLEVWGYGFGTSSASSILPSAFNHLDLEVNGGTANSMINVANARDTYFTPGGYIAPGSVATYVLRESDNVQFSSQSNANQSFDLDAGYNAGGFSFGGYGIPLVNGVRSNPYANNLVSGAFTATGGGVSQFNPNTGASLCSTYPRINCGSFMLYLAGYVGPDLTFNLLAGDTEFRLPIGAATSPLTNSQTLAVGTTTFNLACPATGSNTETLPTIAANGEGTHYWIANVSSGTCTFSAQNSQQFVGYGNAPASTMVIPGYTNYEVWSASIGGTLYWVYK